MAARLTRALTITLLTLAALAAAASLPACAETPPPGYERVTLDGRTFTLELAIDDATRVRGLGGRESIPADGGMLFVFPDSIRRHFVMRDCLVDIDIIYLDASASIVAMHHMTVEEAKREDETQTEYELRLTRYPSRFDSQFVIELQGGTLESLDLSTGEQVELDTKRLRSLLK